MALGTGLANVMNDLLPNASIELPAIAAHWSFDTDYSDVSGNGADGSLVTSGTSASGITTEADQYKFGGGALSIDSGYDYVSVPD